MAIKQEELKIQKPWACSTQSIMH
ncbi:hypothetical protein cypCar_00035139 [Cyprinus carpio]|nr:hypothetical protein cypCar_00035139 [Cyprinus carpio]